MSLSNNLCRSAFALVVAISAAACGDDAPAGTECGAGTTLSNGECVADAECGAGTSLVNGECVGPTCGAGTMLVNGMCVTDPDMTTYRQVEQLGRPGIAEALLITPAFLEGYNATAPSFAGAPPAAVAAISAEAKTVLKAIFHGVCLLNGVAGLTAANGAKPGGVQCAQVGNAVFSDAGGTIIDTAQATAATTYSEKIFGQFITDVLRIDTAQATQGYFAGGASLCAGAAAGAPLLCGGRLLNEDVIDITYFYLLAGAAVPVPAQTPGPVQNQVVALVTDGVFFSSVNGENSGIGLGTPNTANTNQFHQSCANCGTPRITTTFPYSAAPR